MESRKNEVTKSKMRIFVTGIGTLVGKTVVSAILAKAWGASYWKPVQCGDLDLTDSMRVQHLTGGAVECLPEHLRLEAPMSAHAAADLEGLTIAVRDFKLPDGPERLIVEGAGGLLVPLNDSETMLDIIGQFRLPVVVVSRHYLGSINHTLMTVRTLRSMNIPILGIVFNGSPIHLTEEVILRQTGLSCIFRLQEEGELTPAAIERYVVTVPPLESLMSALRAS